jgi:hypothetical protein
MKMPYKTYLYPYIYSYKTIENRDGFNDILTYSEMKSIDS